MRVFSARGGAGLTPSSSSNKTLAAYLELLEAHFQQQLLEGRDVAVVAGQRLAGAPRVPPHRPVPASRARVFNSFE